MLGRQLAAQGESEAEEGKLLVRTVVNDHANRRRNVFNDNFVVDSQD